MPATVLGKRIRKPSDKAADAVSSKRQAIEHVQTTVKKSATKKTATPAKSSVKSIKKSPLSSAKINSVLKSSKAYIEIYQDEKPVEPSTPRHRDALSKKIAVTPRHRFLVGNIGTPRTPRTPSRSSTAVFAQARQLFTRSSTSGRLIGRDAEKTQLQTFIDERLRLNTGGCLYVSGPPGTGKSALVDEICTPFEANDEVTISSSNCMSIRSVQDLINKLALDLDLDEDVTIKDLRAQLFRNTSQRHLIILDEVDQLLELDVNLLCNLFEWSLSSDSRLIVIGIANALDLTDRCLPQLRSRGLKPDLLPVLPYNAAQIANVLEQKLRSLVPSSIEESLPPFMHPMAIQFCAKKVASQTGDLRKAFDICRRAIDLVEQETITKDNAVLENSPTKIPLMENMNIASPPTPRSPTKDDKLGQPARVYTISTAPRATIAHMAKVTSSIFSNGASQRLSTLNLQQKVVLCTLTALEKRKRAVQLDQVMMATPSKTDRSAPSVKQLYDTYCRLCRRSEMLQALTSVEFRDVVSGLETLGLLGDSTGKSGSFAMPMTPSRTPSRKGRAGFGGATMWDDRRLSNVLGEKEIRTVLDGAGGELLREILDGDCL